MRRALRVAGIALALLALLGLVGHLVNSILSVRSLARAQAEYESTFGPIELSELGPGRIAESENAATWLVSGSSALAEIAATAQLGKMARLPWESWSEPERAEAERVLALSRPALELLSRATDCESSSFDIAYSEGAYARLPDYLALLRAHRLVRVAARIDLARGDAEAFKERLRLLFAFSQALAAEPLLISATFALDFDFGLLDLLREVLAGGFGDEPWLHEVRALVESMERREMLWQAFRAEGAVAGSLSMATMEQAWGSPVLLRLRRPALRRMQAGFLAAPTEAARLIDEPFQTSNEGDAAPEEGFLTWAGTPSFHPHMTRLIGEQQTQETARQLALEALRLRREALASGSYPSDNLLPATEPLTGSPFARADTADGGIDLSAPQAQDHYLASSGRPDAVYSDLLRWRLPPASYRSVSAR